MLPDYDLSQVAELVRPQNDLTAAQKHREEEQQVHSKVNTKAVNEQNMYGCYAP
jgi:hypothetical protein